MRISLHAVSLLVLAIALLQCRSNQAQHQAVDQTLNKILGDNYTKLLNDRKTHALAFAAHADSAGYTPYAVVELNKKQNSVNGDVQQRWFCKMGR